MIVVLTISNQENPDYEAIESERKRISAQLDMPVVAVFEGIDISIASETKIYSGTVTKGETVLHGMFQSADELTEWLDSQGEK